MRDHGGDADRPQGLASLVSEIGKLADAAHVALAASGDAVTHPVLFVDDFPVELVALELLLLELHVAPRLERAETLIETAGAAAIEPDRGAGQVRKQPFVVADQRQRRTAIRKMRLQPFDRDQIEMIGRLVEQKDFGLRAQDPDQSRPARFATRKAGRIRLGVDPEFFHHGSRRVRIVEVAKPGKDIIERCGEAGHVRLLRQIGKARGRLDEATSPISSHLAAGNAKQGRFAGSVAANDGDPVASGNRQLRPVQERRAAKGQSSVSQLQEGRHMKGSGRGGVLLNGKRG